MGAHKLLSLLWGSILLSPWFTCRQGLTCGCVVQAVMQLVYEKQHRLRSMMRMHGLSNSVYLLVTYLYVRL